MKMSIKLQLGAQAAAVVVFLTAACANGQTATHFCSGYVSPGTITITNTFTYPAGSTLVGLMWWPQVPAGWTITNVRAPVGSVEMGWDGIIIWLGLTLPASPVVMFYDVVVPAGETGPKNIEADVYYDLGPELIGIRASPDPLVLDNRKTLEVISQYGTATPSVGIHTNLIGTSLSPSVDASVYMGTTQYVCTGWSMIGNDPTSGSANSFTMTVTGNAVLTWNWSIENVAPSITNDVWIVGYRTTQFKPLANKVSEETLLAQANDPDSGDTLTLTSVNTNGLKGVIVSSGGILTYTPPKHTDSIVDTFTYTVTDSKGASAVGTVKVRVAYGGTMIRAY